MKNQDPLLWIRSFTAPDGTKMDIVDSKYSYVIQPNEQERKDGIPHDPVRCMFALAVMRELKAKYVCIAKSRAYFSQRGRNGKLELQRVVLTPAAQADQKLFDDGGKVSGEAVVFAAPEGSQRLGVSRASYQSRKQSGKIKKPKRKNRLPQEINLRTSGVGLFQLPVPKQLIASAAA
jgi:peptidoglycan hydrolase-like protein with peptidoglycan-binding domain